MWCQQRPDFIAWTRLRAVSYLSLPSLWTGSLCLGKNSEERGGKEGEAFPSPHPVRLKACSQASLCQVTAPENQGREPPLLGSLRIDDFRTTTPLGHVTSWFAIALAEMRTGRILRENADCKESKCGPTSLVTGSGWWKEGRFPFRKKTRKFRW